MILENTTIKYLHDVTFGTQRASDRFQRFLQQRTRKVFSVGSGGGDKSVSISVFIFHFEKNPYENVSNINWPTTIILAGGAKHTLPPPPTLHHCEGAGPKSIV